MNRRILYFDGDKGVNLREEKLTPPADGEIQVRTITSAISAGTERMVFEGRLPLSMLEDATLDAVGGTSYPLPYGYACVGEVTQTGRNVPDVWKGERVFAFHPHADRFNVPHTQALRLSSSMSSEDAAFLPNMETALSLLMDAKPVIGEYVCIFGCGVVGGLSTKLLSSYPLSSVFAVDPDPSRRDQVKAFSDIQAVAPSDVSDVLARSIAANAEIRGTAEDAEKTDGPDLILEVSGNPAALNSAIRIAGYGSRILVGSWYGTKKAKLDLGTSFHRSHVRIRSSQVSTIDPDHRGRWTHRRRLNTAMSLLEDLQPSQLVTSRRPFADASEVYQDLSNHPTRQMQILLTYDGS